MAEVASAYVSLLPSGRGFGRRLDSEVGGDVKGAGKRLGATFGKLFALAGGVALGSFFNSAADSASDFNETVNKSNVIFGKNAGAIKKWSKTAATALGLSQEQSLSSAAGFGDMFTQIGFTGAAATKMSTSVVQAAADLGSFSNLDTADVADRMSAAFRGEYDSLQAVIPNINAARVESEAMAATGKKTTAALTAQDKAAAVLAIVHKDGARAMGDFARTSEGVANKSKIVTAQAADMKRKFGALILPVKALGIDAFGAVIAALPKIGDGFANLFDVIRNSKPVAAAIKNIRPSLERIADLTWGKLQGGIDALKRLTQLDFSKIDGQKLGEQLSAAIGKALTALGTLGGKVVSALTDMFGKVDWIGLGIKVGTFAIPFALGLATGIINGIADPALWKGIWEHLPEILLAVLAIAFAPSKLAGGLAKILTKIPFVGRFLAAAVTWVNELGGKLTHFGSDLLSTFWKAFTRGKFPGAAFVGKVMDAIKGLPGRVGDFFGTLGTRIGVWALDAFEHAGRGARTGIGKVLTFMAGVPGKILHALGSLGKLLYNAGTAVISGLAKGIWDATVGRLGRTLSDVTNFIKDHKGPIEKDRVLLEPAGRAIMEGLNIGLEKGIPGLKSMLEKVTQVFKDRKSDLSSLMDEFASISSSVAGKFTTDLFSGSLTDLFSGGHDSLVNLQNVTAAFKKLRKRGAGSGFLHALFESGNSDLITALAGSSDGSLASAQYMFKQQTRLANQLGNMTAQNTLGPDIRGVRQEIKELRKDVRLIGSDLAHALNHTSANAQRKKAHK